MPRQNTGSVFQRKDGFWAAQVTRNGKRLTKIANSEAEAEKLRQQLLAGFFDRAVIPPPKIPNKPTVASFFSQYIAAADFKPMSRQTATQVFNSYIIPVLGSKPLDSLKPFDIVQLIAALKEKELASGSIKLILATFRAALESAVQWELISSNPAAKVKGPKATVKAKLVWTVEQTQQFLTYCQTNPLRWEPLFVLALNTGLRVGELLGLEWSDIDLQRKTLKVQRSIAEIATYNFRKREFVSQTPKSRSSLRTMSLPAQALEALNQWEPDRAKRVGPIFRNKKGNIPIRTTILQSLERACNRAEVPYISMHGLRHQHISLLAHAGVSIKAASIRAGHSSPNITLSIYTHVLEETDTSSATALDALLAKGGVK